ncbi:MAG: DUF3047 domain-containing protein [bacterium]|nr:DUF3047 domain-containing protein [bacterium]
MRVFLAVLTLALVGLLPAPLRAEPLWQADFNQQSGSASAWIKSNGFDLQRDADEIQTEFKEGQLVFSTKGPTLGLFSKELNLKNAQKIRIKWGVNQFPKGADWEKGVLREAVSVVFSFGDKKIDSGSFAIPNVPYFISFFLGEKEQENKAYVGNYYKKGGRYFCLPCAPKLNQLVVTEVPIADLFKKEFGQAQVPPITGIAIEIDTRDTQGTAQAFIQSIEVLP